MGWLGWTARETRGTDVNDLRIALEGRVGLLELMGLAKTVGGQRTRAATPEEWQAFKKRHNAIQRVRARGAKRGGPS